MTSIIFYDTRKRHENRKRNINVLDHYKFPLKKTEKENINDLLLLFYF